LPTCVSAVNCYHQPDMRPKCPAAVLLVLVVAGLSGCVLHSGGAFDHNFRLGYSGIAPLADGYLVVHDSKIDPRLPRLGFVRPGVTAADGYRAIIVTDWSPLQGEPQDLESVCALSGRANEYLLAESGHYAGRTGQVLHVRLLQKQMHWRAQVLHVFDLPRLKLREFADDPSNYEGLACIAEAGVSGTPQSYAVILGERGGSTAFSSGQLRSGRLLLGDDAAAIRSSAQLIFDPPGPLGIEVRPPAGWPANATRAIGDLTIDSQRRVWASATVDPGDRGPFRSLTRPVAQLTIDAASRVWRLTPIVPEVAGFASNGIKIEALTFAIDGSLIFGTDDESFGGTIAVLEVPSPLFYSRVNE
jgi:hypothetical protein